jgi:hypothetical protein
MSVANAALLLPRDEEGRPAWDAFDRNARFVLRAGVSGLCVNGATGEFAGATAEERREAVLRAPGCRRIRTGNRIEQLRGRGVQLCQSDASRILYRMIRWRGNAALIQQRDLVAWADGPLDQNCRVNAGLAVMGSCDSSHDFGVGLRRVGIERDHLAAGVALKDGDHCLGPNLQCAANELVLAKSKFSLKFDINIRSEAPLVEIGSYLLAQLGIDTARAMHRGCMGDGYRPHDGKRLSLSDGES